MSKKKTERCEKCKRGAEAFYLKGLEATRWLCADCLKDNELVLKFEEIEERLNEVKK